MIELRRDIYFENGKGILIAPVDCMGIGNLILDNIGTKYPEAVTVYKDLCNKAEDKHDLLGKIYNHKADNETSIWFIFCKYNNNTEYDLSILEEELRFLAISESDVYICRSYMVISNMFNLAMSIFNNSTNKCYICFSKN